MKPKTATAPLHRRRPPTRRWRHRQVAGLLLSLVTLSGSFAATHEPDLLPQADAFALVSEVAPGQVRLEWTVAPGYFMYRDRFRFRLDDLELAPEVVAVPAGQIEDGPIFGRVEALRDRFAFDVPVPAAGVTELVVISQGCADFGVCYPPYRQSVALGVAGAADTGGALTDLARTLGLGGSAQTFLPVDIAFVMSYEMDSQDRVRVRWDIAPGYYLYRGRIAIGIARPAGLSVDPPDIDRGLRREDPYFGDVEVFYDEAEARVRLPAGASSDPVTLEVRYQGCADAGLCYPPVTRELPLTLPSAPGSGS